MRPGLVIALAAALHAEDGAQRPWMDRVFPLSAQRGTTVQVELVGKGLAKTARVDFDTDEIEWLRTESATAEKVVGQVRVAADAALGPHTVHLDGAEGPSNGRLFNVTQFPVTLENEPNDGVANAQSIELKPQSIQGYMKGLADVDTYAFEAKAGERWVFDLRSIEYGTHLESRLLLLDEQGKRVAINEDRDDYDETPFLEQTFAKSGRYLLKIDQYRGPQGVSCSQNCGYTLEVSQLPRILAVAPLGVRPGATAEFTLTGSTMDRVDRVEFALARQAEHFRMTYPFTMPIRFAVDPRRSTATPRVPAHIVEKAPGRVRVQASFPSGAPAGLWRVWAHSAAGSAAGVNIEVADTPEFTESAAAKADLRSGEIVINGSLAKDNEEDVFRIQGIAGKPIRAWTLAAQFGLPFIDTVVEMRDGSGKIVAQHDDVMSGQGTPVGNPDSSLVFIPKADGPLDVIVRDRIGRGGPTYAYRLHMKQEFAGFQLLTGPENFSLPKGGSGDLTVFLIREPGFEGPVDVWVEGLPPGLEAPKGAFRADQAFGPSADGDNMIIPELALPFSVPAGLAPGRYAIRVLGKGGPDGRIVQAHTSLWIGPPRNRNDVRRPRPAVTLTVLDTK